MKSCGERGFARRADGFRAALLAAVGDIVGDRVVEQESVLRHQADLVAETGQVEIADVAAIDLHGARGGVVEARHQVGERGLAAAARPDQGDHLAGFDLQIRACEAETVGRAGIVERRRCRRRCGSAKPREPGAPGASTTISS